jgi:hypothetical protein
MISPSSFQIKALPSFYAGVKFRSRLEARWARYFDLIGINWQYEPEGYELPSGNYCPDFLCEYDGWTYFIEVKPDDIGQKMVQQKLMELCEMTGTQVVCVTGNPMMKAYWNCEKVYEDGVDLFNVGPTDVEYAQEKCGVSFSKKALEKHGYLYYGECSYYGDEPFYEQATKMQFQNGVAVV